MKYQKAIAKIIKLDKSPSDLSVVSCCAYQNCTIDFRMHEKQEIFKEKQFPCENETID